jgi:hypothetical protein
MFQIKQFVKSNVDHLESTMLLEKITNRLSNLNDLTNDFLELIAKM